MKKKLLATTLAATLLSGCAVHNRVLDGYASDPSPTALNQDDSFAMQLMDSGFNALPKGVKDTVIKEGDMTDSHVVYKSIQGTLGYLEDGFSGGLSSLGWATLLHSGGGDDAKWIYYIAYVPADDIDISEKDKIEQYVRDNYLAPAIDAFMASDAPKKMDPPAEMVSNINNVYSFKGAHCFPTFKSRDEYNNCGDPFERIVANRYATAETMPFTPSIKANKYIVVRILDSSLTSLGAALRIQTDMMYAFIPTRLPVYKDMVNKVIPNTILNYPYIVGKNGKSHYFLKTKKD